MKLLIQHPHTYPDEISGILTYIQIIKSELESRDIQVRVISTVSNSVEEWFQAIAWANVVHMNSNSLRFALICKMLNRKIILKYHYLFYQSTHDQYEPMSFPQRLKVEVLRSLPKANTPLKWKLFTAVKWARLATRLTTSCLVDHRISCSQFLAESYSLPMQILTSYNPIQISPHQLPKQLADLKQPYHFVFAGRLTPDKGADLLIQAAHQLRQIRDDFRIQIMGYGNQAEELQQLADHLQVSDQVDFLGHCKPAEVVEHLRSALALVVPSRWQEPAGYVVLEAASVQTGAIASQVGGLPEVTGSQGLFFAAEDVTGLAQQMQACLENPQAALERGQKACEYVAEKFSAAKAVDELLSLC
ncbi:MAG: glycosyltransferase [Oculatellaceae cyanobacterium Prado106]|jgi:glycosyltransferase involved in cell wall biosynthesis|nr:glycosyltransferase [Oculatellaceae cyanobacterium Prado106]